MDQGNYGQTGAKWADVEAGYKPEPKYSPQDYSNEDQGDYGGGGNNYGSRPYQGEDNYQNRGRGRGGYGRGRGGYGGRGRGRGGGYNRGYGSRSSGYGGGGEGYQKDGGYDGSRGYQGGQDNRYHGGQDNRYHGGQDNRYHGGQDNRYQGGQDNRYGEGGGYQRKYNGGGGYDRNSGDRGGYGDGGSRRFDNYPSDPPPGHGQSQRDIEYPPLGSDSQKPEEDIELPAQRPSLKISKRSVDDKPLAKSAEYGKSKPNPFGKARPREEILAERGLNVSAEEEAAEKKMKEVEDQLLKTRLKEEENQPLPPQQYPDQQRGRFDHPPRRGGSRGRYQRGRGRRGAYRGGYGGGGYDRDGGGYDRDQGGYDGGYDQGGAGNEPHYSQEPKEQEQQNYQDEEYVKQEFSNEDILKGKKGNTAITKPIQQVVHENAFAALDDKDDKAESSEE